MLQIDHTLISLDVVEKKFCCDLEKCKGACCVKGDSGAPLTEEETQIIGSLYDKIKPFLRPEGIAAIEQLGQFVIDEDGESVTTLVNKEECAYAIFENGIAKCGIEKAFLAGKIDFQKPVSCHLYPVRIRKYHEFTAVNYDTWDICHPAREKGKKVKLNVHDFVRDALIRRFGIEWYTKLQLAAENVRLKRESEGK